MHKQLKQNSFLASYSGSFKVDIPWTSLFSASVVVNVEDVYLLAGPITDRVYDPERERALQNAVKRQLLETMELENAAKTGENAGFCLPVSCVIKDEIFNVIIS